MNAGRPANHMRYAVEYKKSTGTRPFSTQTHYLMARHYSRSEAPPPRSRGWKPDTSYQVRVQATNGPMAQSPWSFVGTGSTNKEGNSAPSFKPSLKSCHRVNVSENHFTLGRTSAAAVTADDAGFDAR